jgi:hypothetical protein
MTFRTAERATEEYGAFHPRGKSASSLRDYESIATQCHRDVVVLPGEPSPVEVFQSEFAL